MSKLVDFEVAWNQEISWANREIGRDGLKSGDLPTKSGELDSLLIHIYLDDEVFYSTIDINENVNIKWEEIIQPEPTCVMTVLIPTGKVNQNI